MRRSPPIQIRMGPGVPYTVTTKKSPIFFKLYCNVSKHIGSYRETLRVATRLYFLSNGLKLRRPVLYKKFREERFKRDQETGHQSREPSGTGNETQFNMADGEDKTVLPGSVYN